MPELLQKEAFAENLNTKFRIPQQSSSAAEIELVEVTEARSTSRLQQFSLFFRGPLESFLPQGTYHVEHERLGSLDLFIVPVGKEQDGFRYEAVFNYVIEAN